MYRRSTCCSSASVNSMLTPVEGDLSRTLLDNSPDTEAKLHHSKICGGIYYSQVIPTWKWDNRFMHDHKYTVQGSVHVQIKASLHTKYCFTEMYNHVHVTTLEYIYPVSFYDGRFWPPAIHGPSTHPWIETFIWIHPRWIDGAVSPKTISNMVQNVSCYVLQYSLYSNRAHPCNTVSSNMFIRYLSQPATILALD